MQRLFRKSSIRILRKKNNYFIYSHCFYIVSLTILSKILIKTFNGKILRYIKIYLNLLPLKVFNSIFYILYQHLFKLQVLSAKFNENVFVNLLGVWTASIFVELYEDSRSLYVCFIIYR